tara:strand:+ start:8907 stop:9071 length:165 start_codon:yes stop_codon:yes gene_type:complete
MTYKRGRIQTNVWRSKKRAAGSKCHKERSCVMMKRDEWDVRKDFVPLGIVEALF